jgi:dCMP deaminase
MRIDWDQYFLAMAHLASVRSHDEQTQVGCVIVNDKNHIVSIGYNGFPASTRDENLPRVRPGKYPFILHAEQNAISNMIIKDNNLRAYVTAYPCSTCSKLLWQNNIRELIVDKEGIIYSMNEGDIAVINFLIENGLKIKEIKFDQDVFKNLGHKLKRG